MAMLINDFLSFLMVEFKNTYPITTSLKIEKVIIFLFNVTVLPSMQIPSFSNLEDIERWSSSLAQLGKMNKLVKTQTANPMPMVERRWRASSIILSARKPDTTTRLKVSMKIMAP